MFHETMHFEDSLVVYPTESEVESCVCVCGIPTLDEDVVSCDSCERLYHRRCVNTTNVTTSQASTSSTSTPSSSSSSSSSLSSSSKTWMCDSCVHLLLGDDFNEGEGVTIATNEQSRPSDTSSSSMLAESATPPTTDKSSSRKTQNPKVYRPPSKLTKDVVLETKVQRIEVIMEDVQNHKDFKTKHGCGQDVIHLSQSLLQHTNNTYFATFCEKITSDMWEVAISGDRLPVGPSSHEAMWKSFHEYRMSEDLSALWLRLLDSCKVHSKHIVEQLLLQHILRLMLFAILRERNAADELEEIVPDVNLTEQDELVIRYASGYVPVNLIKRYNKQKSETAQEYVQLLSSWKKNEIDSTSFLNYTNVWINIQDRGGLFHVSDNVFRLFRRMEKKTQETLQLNRIGTLKKTNVKVTLTSKLQQDVFVRKMWEEAIAGRSGKVDWEPLFISVVNYWVKIRLHAFVKVYLELRKRDAASKRGEKSLRKELTK